MSQVVPSAVPAGWYKDPSGLPTMRWFDGRAWTEQLAPLPQPNAQPVAPPKQWYQAEVPFTIKVAVGTLVVLFVLFTFGAVGS